MRFKVKRLWWSKKVWIGKKMLRRRIACHAEDLKMLTQIDSTAAALPTALSLRECRPAGAVRGDAVENARPEIDAEAGAKVQVWKGSTLRS
jgi:hypothetical protein